MLILERKMPNRFEVKEIKEKGVYCFYNYCTNRVNRKHNPIPYLIFNSPDLSYTLLRIFQLITKLTK